MPLCNSHVIPEFFYEQMRLYDDKHRFNILSTDPHDERRIAQKGIREKLLCGKCELKFSQWEDYARRLMYGGEGFEVTVNTPKGIECTVAYSEFKLFQLSILWRVGITTRDEFSSIDLRGHEESIRAMLLGEQPGEAEVYGCILFYSSKHTDITSNMIHCMDMSEIDGVPCVPLLLGDFYWLFFLSKTALNPWQRSLFLQETGHLRICKTDIDPNQYIGRLARDIYTANRKHFEQNNKGHFRAAD